MAWYAVTRATDGEAVSFGSVLPEKLPRGLTAIQLDHMPDMAAEQWDAATRSLLPRPPEPVAPTLADRLATAPELAAFDATQRAAVLAALARAQGLA